MCRCRNWGWRLLILHCPCDLYKIQRRLLLISLHYRFACDLFNITLPVCSYTNLGSVGYWSIIESYTFYTCPKAAFMCVLSNGCLYILRLKFIAGRDRSGGYNPTSHPLHLACLTSTSSFEIVNGHGCIDVRIAEWGWDDFWSSFSRACALAWPYCPRPVKLHDFVMSDEYLTRQWMWEPGHITHIKKPRY